VKMNVTLLAGLLQSLLTTKAEELAQATGLVQRQRKLTGALWVQTLVFGWMEQPQASLEDLCDWLAEHHQITISPQGLDGWFCPAGAACLQQLAPLAVGALLQSQSAAVPLLERFAGVYVEDGTTIALPASLAAPWPGCGGNDPQGRDQAALKAYVRLELSHGQVTDLAFAPGRVPDVCLGQKAAPLPAGALRLKDLGFFDTGVLAQDTRAGVYWISRLPCRVDVQVGTAARQPLADWLAQQTADQLDVAVQVGVEQPLAGRLVVARCPEEVRQRRLRKLRERASKKGRSVSARQETLCGWTVLLTNLPPERLSRDEAWVLYRARWQIELLFKLWKSHGRLAQSLGHRGDRVLTEVLAKLVAALVQHWLLLLAGPWLENLAAARKLRRLRQSLAQLVEALDDAAQLVEELQRLQRRLQRLRRRKRRRQKPSTLDLLNEPRRAKLGVS
jgi:Transposase DDE domain